MNSYLVITATGKDRVGIADELAEHVLAAGCNIEESKMAILGGEFAVLLLVSGSPDAIERLAGAADSIGAASQLDVSMRRTEAQAAPTGIAYRIETVSLDTPGIVHAITSVLRRNGVNIDELETETTGAPFTGAPMFRMRIRAVFPPGVQPRRLRSELELAADEHDVDLRVEALGGGDGA